MEVLIINGHDYSKYVESKGYEWRREDLDSSASGRNTKSGKMRRNKICTKRPLKFSLINMPPEDLAQLDDDLSEETFSATYLDLHGVMAKTFYCTSLSATLSHVVGDKAYWGDASFSMIEV